MSNSSKHSNVRESSVSGSFYPDSKKSIYSLLDNIRAKINYSIPVDFNPVEIYGAIVPHAGFMYSAWQTIPVFETISFLSLDFDSIVILHPLHRGGYFHYATDENDFWMTPVGKLGIDREFIKAMGINISNEMLASEHSAEVLLPYLQYFGWNEKKIIPIGIAHQSYNTALEISKKIIKAQNRTGRKIFILASSDFSHFLSPERGYIQDQKVLDCIKERNAKAVFQAIIKEKISVCGYGPIMTLMEIILAKDKEYKMEVLSRGHSGQVEPAETVVDYISMLLYK